LGAQCRVTYSCAVADMPLLPCLVYSCSLGQRDRKISFVPLSWEHSSVFLVFWVSTLCNGWGCSDFSPKSSRVWRTRWSGNRSSKEARLSTRACARFTLGERPRSRAALGRFFRLCWAQAQFG